MKKRAIAIIIEDKKILLQRHVKNGNEYFMFPSCGAEKDEAVKKALIKGIKAEYDLDIKIHRSLFQTENSDRHGSYFLIKEFTGNPIISDVERKKLDEDNHHSPAWKKLEELEQMGNLFPKNTKDMIIEMSGNL